MRYSSLTLKWKLSLKGIVFTYSRMLTDHFQTFRNIGNSKTAAGHRSAAFLFAMKNTLLTLTLLLMSWSISAQTLEITYAHAKKYRYLNQMKSENRFLQKSDDNVFARLSEPDEYLLTHRNGVSVYKAKDQDVEDPLKVNGNVTVRINKDGYRDYVFYKDQVDKQMTNQVNVLYKKLLVEDQLPVFNWTITDSTKLIGKYNCRMAHALDPIEDHEIVVWYAEEIPINDGPRACWGLPGAILELHGETDEIVATQVVYLPEEPALLPPTKGKRVTLAQYHMIVDDLNDGNIQLQSFKNN